MVTGVAFHNLCDYMHVFYFRIAVQKPYLDVLLFHLFCSWDISNTIVYFYILQKMVEHDDLDGDQRLSLEEFLVGTGSAPPHVIKYVIFSGTP